jgi:hypothetical protein
LPLLGLFCLKGVNAMLSEVTIVFFEDSDFKNQIAQTHLSNVEFSHVENIIKTIKQAQNDCGNPCHYKITGYNLDF